MWGLHGRPVVYRLRLGTYENNIQVISLLLSTAPTFGTDTFCGRLSSAQLSSVSQSVNEVSLFIRWSAWRGRMSGRCYTRCYRYYCTSVVGTVSYELFSSLMGMDADVHVPSSKTDNEYF